MSQNPPAPPQSFCVAPWIHAHVAAGGKRRLCCVAPDAPDAVSKLSWDEFKNSSYVRSIRKMMLNGEIPKDCHACSHSNRSDVYRNELNRRYAEKIPAILQKTDEDGYTTVPVNYIDYRSNLCNLKCRICDPSTSTTYQNYINRQSPEIGTYLFGDNYKSKAEPIRTFYSEKYAPESLQLIETEDIDSMYFAGGEPVIEPSHLPLLKKIISMKKAQSVQLFYNTNLSFSPSIVAAWLNEIRHFKKCDIFISADGTDKIYNYIREGSSFDLLNENLDRVLADSAGLPNISCSLDITLTSLNLFYITDFCDYALSKKIRVIAKLMIFGDHSFPLLRTEAIPAPIKEKILTKWSAYYNLLPSHEKDLLQSVNAAMDIFRHSASWSDDMVPELLQRLQSFEAMYPASDTFMKLLSTSPLGCEWLSFLDTLETGTSKFCKPD